MKLSTKGRYGVRAMYELAVRQQGDPVPLSEIAAGQEISEAYLEQLMAKLRRAGLIKSVRGAQGGYLLAKAPHEITVGDILRPLEGTVGPTECAAQASACTGTSCCAVRTVWARIKAGFDAVVDGITLQDVVEAGKEENH
jgi:Rrf2 family cysteine metabolism transcriptional repressor